MSRGGHKILALLPDFPLYFCKLFLLVSCATSYFSSPLSLHVPKFKCGLLYVKFCVLFDHMSFLKNYVSQCQCFPAEKWKASTREQLKISIEKWKVAGFINYFGTQRFWDQRDRRHAWNWQVSCVWGPKNQPQYWLLYSGVWQ